jgi:PAS domain S-box-containing protein
MTEPPSDPEAQPVAGPSRYFTRRMRFEWLLLLLALLALGVFIGRAQLRQYDEVETAERQRMEAQIRVVDEYVGERLRQVDAAMRQILIHVPAPGTRFDLAWRSNATQHLRSLVVTVHGVRNVSVLDAGGNPIAAVGDASDPYSEARRAAFEILRKRPDPDLLYVSPPVVVGDHETGIVFSIARLNASGQVAGAVALALSAECCSALMDSFRYAPDMFLGISHGDGRAFLFAPERPELAGIDLATPGSLFSRHRDGGRVVSVLSGPNTALGTEQLAVLKTVKPLELVMDRPLVIGIGRDRAQIHAAWRSNAIRDGVLFLLVVALGVAALATVQHRQNAVFSARNQAEVERREAAERLGLATRATGLGIWEYDPATGQVLWDEGMYQRMGIPRANTAGLLERWRAIIDPEDHPAFDAVLDPESVVAAESVTVLRIRVGGDLHVFQVRSNVVAARGARTLRVIGTAQDVTADAAASDRLRSNEARLKAIFDVLPVGIAITDEQGRIVDCNLATEYLFKTNRRRLLAGEDGGLEGEMHYPDGTRVVSSESAPARALRSGRPVYDEEVHVDLPDGERRLSVSAIPILSGKAGRVPGGVVIAYVDVSAIRRNEDALLKLSRALDQSGAAVMVTDVSGVIEYVNAAACTKYGYAESELLGQTPRLFKSGLTPLKVYQELWDTILAGEVWRGELANRKRDGGLVYEAVSVSPVRDPGGRIAHFVAVREDISTRIANERLRGELSNRLSRVERMEVLGAMAGGVAHDFNNILVAILGFSSLGKGVAEASGALPKIASYFDEIETAGLRARMLVKQLLEFSRGGTLTLAVNDLASVARASSNLARTSLPEGVTLEVAVEDGLTPIMIDTTHLFRVLDNLLANARDAMEGPGSLSLDIRRVEIDRPVVCDSCHGEFAGNFVLIAVSDEGRGIPENARARIFEPFFTTKELAEGTGMGLAVVHGVVHNYGGHVQVSARPERGTEFRIYLPQSMLREERRRKRRSTA